MLLSACAPAGSSAGPEPVEPYVELFRASATPESPASVLAAQASVESGFDPDAVSPAGAEGLMQFIPSTWARFGVDGDGDGTADPFTPADAVPSAVAYRAHLRDVLGGVPGAETSPGLEDLVLAGYNAGPGAVLASGGVPPFAETVAYVERVGAEREQYADLDAPAPPASA